MASPNSRATLIDYCKRRLGDPVIEINVDDDQVEDRIDEAIQYYQEFHSDATLRGYLKHKVTQADIDNKYITISDDVLFVSKMLVLPGGTSTSRNMFSLKYQMHLNDISQMHRFNGDLAYFEQMQQYLDTLDMILNGAPIIEFSRKQNRVYIHGNFEDKDILVDDYIVFETYSTINPDSHTSIYNDMWLKAYATSLIKEQWGQNLMKFEGMVLPGGVQINASQIYGEAQREIQELEFKIRSERELPPDFFMG